MRAFLRNYFSAIAILIFVLYMLFVVLGGKPARAHEWFMGAHNPKTGASCCNDADCRAIDEEDWWQKEGKIFVRWSDGNVYSMPTNEAMPSQDMRGRAAACVWGNALRCFFLPLNG